MTVRKTMGSAGRAPSPSGPGGRSDRPATPRGSARDDTGRGRTPEPVLAHEALLRALIENSPDAISVKDTQSRWLMANPAVLRIVGLSAQDALGKTDLELYADTKIGKAILENDRRILEGKRPETFEEWADTPDGRRLFLSTKAPWFDGRGNVAGLIGISHDITERRQAEAALRLSEDKFSKAFRNSPNAITITRLSDGRIIEGNESAYELFGYSPDEVIGKTTADLEIWADPGDRQKLVNGLASKGFIRNEEFVLQKKDKSRMFVNLSASLITFDDQKCFLSSFVDITKRKRAEEALASVAAFPEENPFPVLRADAQGKLLFANPAAATLIAHWQTPVGAPLPAELGESVRAARADGAARELEIRCAGRDLSFTLIPVTGRSYVNLYGRDITLRKEAEEALRQSTRRFQTIVDNAPIAIYVKDRNGRFVFGNRPLERLTGHPLERLLGMTDYDFASKEDADRWRANDLKVMAGQRAEFEEIGTDRDGRPYVNISVKFPLVDEAGTPVEICGISTDITERKRAEELRRVLLEQEKSRLGAAVEQASDSVVMVDLDGTIRYVNVAFESINGIARSAAAGTSYFDFMAGEPAEAGAIREAIASGRSWRGAVTRSVRDGRPVELEVTLSPAKDASGAVIGGLITEKDVTRENALQNQVRQAQKMEALGTLAGGITHDFNNILGSIILNTELALLDLDSTNPARRPLPLVLQAANRGKDLVKQIITFSRQRTWEKRPVEIAPVIQEGLRFFQTALPKDVQIQETIDAGSGVVLADPSHINQVLVNLCQNAILAMPDGGRLEVVLAPVEVDEVISYQNPNLKPGPYARLTISDTGCGMTREIQAHIFEPFFTTRPKGAGSGLGLAVVHGIVRTYDGEITVASELGRGSTFNVYFPRLEAEGLTAGIDKEDRPQTGEERVLLVEDEQAQRQSLKSGLGRLGYKVTARADGRSALAAFKKDPAAFDIVITDQIMFRMTGLELASAITAIRPDLPVILCTGFSEKVTNESISGSGMRGLMMKPFTLLEITRLIRKVLDGKADGLDSFPRHS